MAQKGLDIAEGQTDMLSSCDIGIDDMKPELVYPSEAAAVEAILKKALCPLMKTRRTKEDNSEQS